MTDLAVQPTPVALSSVARWLIVAGGFHRSGGMDKANAALLDYLLAHDASVHVVAHEVEDRYRDEPRLTIHRVPRPLGSPFAGEWPLRRQAREVARLLAQAGPQPRIVGNGGNFPGAGITWMHCVHHAWPVRDAGAPLAYRAKHRLVKLAARRDERRAVRQARLVIANSERTRRDVIDHLGVAPERVHTVYLGADAHWTPASAHDRAAARAWLDVPVGRPLAVFVGALGHDHNKGFDTLWAAWRSLCADAAWDADLVVAGDGPARVRWASEVERAGLATRVRLIGFTDRVSELLAAADLLVSPVRYEAYGLNVQEALCRGVPAIVSACAGIAERYPGALGDVLLGDPSDVTALITTLRRWRADVDGWRARVEPLGASLRAHSWDDMARRIIELSDR